MEEKLIRVLGKVYNIILDEGRGGFPIEEIEQVLAEAKKVYLINQQKENKIDYDQILEDFHFYCKSLPRVKVLNLKRKASIKARVKEFGYESLEDVFALAEASNFLSGRESYWKASFDWLINPTNFLKVLEGNYLNKGEQSTLEAQDGAPVGYEHFNITYKGAKVYPMSWKKGKPCHKNLAMDILLKKEFNDKQ